MGDRKERRTIKRSGSGTIRSGTGIRPGPFKRGCIRKYKFLFRGLSSGYPYVVNAAGYGKIGVFQKLEETEQLGMVQLNCEALTRMIKICLPYMSAGSRIINLASAAAFGPQPEFAVYAASKSYVYSFSNALRSELKNQEIYVTAVCPGPVDTEFFEHTGEERPASVKDKLFVEARDVVKKALIDSKKKRAVSVYGLPMKAARTASGMIPDPWIARLFQKMNDKKH